ncbi:MAE_28990/MAE_18760 family HEPN-like nuclease [Acinetobacter johnsonii]|jgi:hypothetical protein|uniref:MAE_28990/MAE_18760 family HEPN-like nuclease n=1 Tax=Acinetobacter johnsonii TaxID=40214 RepID=UPI00244B4B1C|nr:MAE_28990/MAE_18760 family HEPN-like nuclease [Acinetobacter johnsonii]MDH1727393.1 MAE_28990/MAE_18760 family HEPN-like nuclease [Acinetobacter johnsonii]
MRIEDLDSQLDSELSWRKKEISSLNSIALNIDSQSDDTNDKVLYTTVMKTLFLLLYSHWEGFVKKTSKMYLKYINEDKVVASELTKNFTALMLKKTINICSEKESLQSLSISNYLDFVEQHEGKLRKKFKVDVKVDQDFDDGFIQTFSNLNYKNYKNIINSLNLPLHDFFNNINNKIEVEDVNGEIQKVEYLTYLLDFNLLMLRNSIAHGGSSLPDLSFENYRILEEKILFIMNQHKLDIQEFCYKKFYKKANFLIMNEYIASQKVLVDEFFTNIDKQTNAADFEDENEDNIIHLQAPPLEILDSTM